MNYMQLWSITEFGQPAWLLLTAIPIVSLLIHYLVSSRYLPPAYFDTKMSYWYLNHNKSFIFSNKKQTLIEILFWLFFAIALSGPQYPERIDEEINVSGESILVLLDTSASMNSRDVQPSRLLKAKSKIFLLVDKLKSGDRLGLMLFSGSAHLLFPPTHDKDAMRFFIKQIKPNLLPLTGSAFETALTKAEDILTKQNSDSSSNIILLISDGDVEDENLSLTNIKNLDLITPIYTLSIGNDIDTPIPSSNDTDQWFRLNSGEIATSNRNNNFLQQLSNISKGAFSEITDSDNDLDYIYTKKIKKNKKKQKERGNTNWIQLYHSFLIMAIMIFFYQRILKSGY